MRVHVWSKSPLASCSRPLVRASHISGHLYTTLSTMGPGQLHTERAPCHPPGLHKYWPVIGHGQLSLRSNFNKAKITLNGISGITAPKGYFIPALLQRFPNPPLSFWGPCVWEPFPLSGIPTLSCPSSSSKLWLLCEDATQPTNLIVFPII